MNCLQEHHCGCEPFTRSRQRLGVSMGYPKILIIFSCFQHTMVFSLDLPSGKLTVCELEAMAQSK